MNVQMSGRRDNPPLLDLSVTSKHTIINTNPYKERIMSCKKISFNTLANVLASVSAVGLAGIIGTGTYVYVNREAIIDDVKEKAIEEVLKKVGGGALGGAGGAIGDFPLKSPAAAPQASAPVPSGGLGVANF